MGFQEDLTAYQERVEDGVERLLPSRAARPARLHGAMRYAMAAGGKRLRPVLLLAASEVSGSEHDPLPAAVAVECLHTYSLIHDDLPCVDDSDLRRGRPACHKAYDEPTALLAGDALLTRAFELLAGPYAHAPSLGMALTRELASAAGSERLIGGQMEDIANEGGTPDEATLGFIHRNKTAALIAAALTMGFRFSEPSAETLERMREAGTRLGMAFQIVDDVLDVTATAEQLGKPVGNDHANHKDTYVALHGLEGSRERATEHTARAIEALESLGGDTTFLVAFARHLEHRIH